MTEKQLPSVAEKAQLTRVQQEATEKLILKGDLEALTPPERIAYYNAFCDRLGLDPVTRPFQLLKLNGKLQMYLDKGGAEQLNASRHISHKIIGREKIDELFVVTAQASVPEGRVEESIGAVSIANLRGEALANAMMKAETKAKRRSTLSVCGLGVIDDSEVDTIAGAQKVNIDDVTEKEPPKKSTSATSAKNGQSTKPSAVTTIASATPARKNEETITQASTKASLTATEAKTGSELPEQEIVDADPFDIERTGQPGQDAWVSIEQAGVKKGWDAEVLENWVIDKLLAEGVLKEPPSSEEEIYSAWSWAFVDSCLDFVNNNAQPAG